MASPELLKTNIEKLFCLLTGQSDLASYLILIILKSSIPTESATSKDPATDR